MEETEWIKETKELIGRLNCFIDEKTMQALLGLYLVEDDPEYKLKLKSDVESIIGSYSPYLFFSKKPLLPSPAEEDCEGEITLGMVIQGENEIRPFSISLEDINKHIAIFASTGSGKDDKNSSPEKPQYSSTS